MGVLQGKVAIVTGGGDGVGRDICTALAKEGAHVAIVDIDESAAAAVAGDLEAAGAQVIAIRCDICDSGEIAKVVQETVDWFGTVDILVNSAHATGRDAALEDMTDADFELALTAGATATFRFMRACHPHLVGGGHVINVNSGTEVAAIPKSATREWDWYGITVNSLSPELLGDDHPDHFDGLLTGVPIPFSALADSGIGRVAVFLAGPDASFATGCTVAAGGTDALVA